MNEIELFHGSKNEFQEFDMARISMTMYGWGFNFTTDLDFASDFGNKIYTIELPDDSKFLDFETTDLGDEIFEKFCEDIENHGISKDFIDMSGTDGSFKEAFWMMETNYVKLLGLSKEDAMKRLTNIVKTFGFLGSKYKDIYVIFDKENMKIKNIRKLHENFSFSNISKKVINESLSKMAYHFTDLPNLHKMIDTDTIKFSKARGRDRVIGVNYGRGAEYFLSATRVRDSRFGFSPGFNVRIELNTDGFNNKFFSKPISFFQGPNGTSCKNDYLYNSEYTDSYDIERQPHVENEDRIYSKVSEVHNIGKYINRIDILLPINNLESYLTSHRETCNMLRDIYNTPFGLKTFVYNNRNMFNRQGKNITLQLMDEL